METLKKIISAFGPSGREDAVREVLKNEIEQYVDDIKIDNLGYLI